MKKLLIVGGILTGIILALGYYLLMNKTIPTAKLLHKVTPVPTVDFEKESAELKDIRIFAWLPWWDQERTIASLQTAKSKLYLISPVWYHIDGNSNLEELVTEKDRNKITTIASSSSILLLPTINNETTDGFDGQRISRLLQDQTARQKLISQLISAAQMNNYNGFDIDWEEVNGSSKQDFTDFMKEFGQALHQRDLLLSVSVHPQTGEDDFEGTKSQDWQELPKYVDYMRIMAYDFHYSTSSPGPVTPIDDLHSVLTYATKIIPLDKIVLGIPDYGYDWVGNKGESVQYADMINTLKKNNGHYSRDPVSTALRGEYTDAKGEKHEVWFEDKNSIVHKIRVGRSYGIDNFSLWSLDGEDLTIWNLVI